MTNGNGKRRRDPDLDQVRERLAAALGIRVEDLTSRVSKAQPLAFKLFVGAYALDHNQVLPRLGIAEFFARPQSWVNFAIDSIERRIAANYAAREYIDRVAEAIKPPFRPTRRHTSENF